jgi:hypothetical protein
MTTTRRKSSTRRSASLRSVPVANAPLVRLPRVRAAQKRIESGFYDRNDVRDRLANAVLQVILKG